MKSSLADLGVREAVGDQAEDLVLAARSARRGRSAALGARRAARTARSRASSPRGRAARCPAATVRIAAMSCSGGSSLRTKPLAPALQRLVDVLVEVERREDQDARVGVGGEDPPRRLEAVELGHADVHEHDGRVGSARPSRRPRGRCPPRRRPRCPSSPAEQQAEAGADHRLVVGDEDADAHRPRRPRAAGACSGRSRRRSRARGHLAAVELHALARCRRARGRGRRSSARAAPVVADLDAQLAGAVADRRRRPGSRPRA